MHMKSNKKERTFGGGGQISGTPGSCLTIRSTWVVFCRLALDWGGNTHLVPTLTESERTLPFLSRVFWYGTLFCLVGCSRSAVERTEVTLRHQ